MTDLALLAAMLLSNFRTIRIPAKNEEPSPSGDWWGAARARRADKRAVYAYRDHIRRELVRHGHHRFLHHLEPDQDGGWRLHLLFADDSATSLLDEIAEGRSGAGDPANFNPEEFVRERLGEWVERDIVRL
jgi:hypothetical protein